MEWKRIGRELDEAVSKFNGNGVGKKMRKKISLNE